MLLTGGGDGALRRWTLSAWLEGSAAEIMGHKLDNTMVCQGESAGNLCADAIVGPKAVELRCPGLPRWGSQSAFGPNVVPRMAAEGPGLLNYQTASTCVDDSRPLAKVAKDTCSTDDAGRERVCPGLHHEAAGRITGPQNGMQASEGTDVFRDGTATAANRRGQGRSKESDAIRALALLGPHHLYVVTKLGQLLHLSLSEDSTQAQLLHTGKWSTLWCIEQQHAPLNCVVVREAGGVAALQQCARQARSTRDLTTEGVSCTDNVATTGLSEEQDDSGQSEAAGGHMVHNCDGGHVVVVGDQVGFVTVVLVSFERSRGACTETHSAASFQGQHVPHSLGRHSVALEGVSGHMDHARHDGLSGHDKLERHSENVPTVKCLGRWQVLEGTPVLGIFGFSALPIGHLLLGLTNNELWWVHIPILAALETLLGSSVGHSATDLEASVVLTTKEASCWDPSRASRNDHTTEPTGGLHHAEYPEVPMDSCLQALQQGCTGAAAALSAATKGPSGAFAVVAKCAPPRSHRIVSADVNVECGVIVVGDVAGCVSAFAFPASFLTAGQETARIHRLTPVMEQLDNDDDLRCRALKSGGRSLQLPLVANLGRCHGNTPVTMVKCSGQHKVLTGGRNGKLHSSIPGLISPLLFAQKNVVRRLLHM
jgi:hypothetical protein